MTDDPDKTDADAKLVAGQQPYEIFYFARKHGIKTAEAREIILKHGPSRRACDEAVKARRYFR